MSTGAPHSVCLYFLAIVINTCVALPTELQSNVQENETTFNPFSPAFRWKNYSTMITFTTGMVVGTGLALLTTAFFFPYIGYKLCYALGGCSNTFDILDDFMGVERPTRRISKRDVQQTSTDINLDYFMTFLKTALRKYDDKPTSHKDEQTQTNIMRLTPESDHQIEKRSPLDYIEPILVMLSKAYNEYVDPELKKNFRKRRSTR